MIDPTNQNQETNPNVDTTPSSFRASSVGYSQQDSIAPLSNEEYQEFQKLLDSLTLKPALAPPESLSQNALNHLREILKHIIVLVQDLQMSATEGQHQVSQQEKILTELDLLSKQEANKKAEKKLDKQEEQKKINLAIGISVLVVSCIFCPTLAAAACCLAVGGAMLACNEMGVFEPGGEFDDFCEKHFGEGSSGEAMKTVLRLLIVLAAVAVTGGICMGSGAGATTAAMIAGGNGINVLSGTQTITTCTTSICEAQGKDEEETQRIAMITNIVVTVVLILAMVGGGAMASNAGSGTGASSGKNALNSSDEATQGGSSASTQAGAAGSSTSSTAQSSKTMGQRFREIADKLDEATQAEDIVKILKMIMIAGGAASTAGAISEAMVQMEMAEIEKDIGKLKGDQEAFNSVKKLLKALIKDFGKVIQDAESMKNHTFDFLQGLIRVEEAGMSQRRA